MAQGNPAWPSGQFNQEDYHSHPHNLYSSTYQPGSYDAHGAHATHASHGAHAAHQGFDGPNTQVNHSSMYMNWTGNPAMEASSEHAAGIDEYGSGTFAGQNTTSPASQQPYSGQSYYTQAVAVDAGAGASHGQARQFDYRSSPDSHQMWMPAMSNQAKQQPQQQHQQQQQQQQRPTASPGPGNFPSNTSWQATSNTPPHGAFPQQNHQQYGVPVSHSGYPQPSPRTNSATPSGIRPAVHGTHPAGADQQHMYEPPYQQPVQMREGAGRSTPQPAEARNSPYQFQAPQGMVGGHTYATFAAPNGQSQQVMYQNQIPYSVPQPTQSPANVPAHLQPQRTGQAVFSAQAPMQQPEQHQPVAQIKRTLTPTQKQQLMTPNGPGSVSNAAVAQGAIPRQPGNPAMPPQVTMQQQQRPQATQLTSQVNGVAPTAAASTAQSAPTPTPSWTPVPGTPVLFFSNTPVQMEPVHKGNRGGLFIAQFNERQKPLLPGHPNRLPGEILRDFQAYENAVGNPSLSPAESQAMRVKLAQLDQEMLQVTGRTAQTYPRQAPTKRSARKAKGSRVDKSGPDSPDVEDSSDYSSEEEESQLVKEIRKRLSEPRPKDPSQSVRWDVEKIVWRSDEAPPGWTANAIAEFGRYLKVLWDDLKQLRTDVKATDEKSRKWALLKKELEAKSAQVLMAIRTAVESSYNPVLMNMGGNQQLCSIFSNMLRSAYLMEDYSGPLPKTILQLMSKITNMDKTFLLDKLKFQKVLVKYRKSLDSESVAAFEHIISSSRDDKDQSEAKPAEKRSAPTANDAAPKTAKADVAAPPKRVPSILAKDLKSASKLTGLKRPSTSVGADSRRVLSDSTKALVPASSAKRGRDEEEDSRATKKVATDVGLAKRPRDDEADSRSSKKVVIDGTNGAQSTAKPSSTSSSTSGTTSQVRAKPTSSILPGKSRPVVKPAAKRPEPPASSSLSTISGLLAQISKPKSPPKTRACEPVRAPETPEEKERRLRKEARRKLRVQWAPEGELEQIRVFEHDATEDEGRASNMIQDARDNRSEGQMLKRGISRDDEDEMDVDDNNNNDNSNSEGNKTKTGAISLRAWAEPSATDFSAIDGKKREKSFLGRGGLREVASGQQKYMEEYERRELMVVYTSASDIPETPKSPPRNHKSEAAATQTRYGQLPSDKAEFLEVHRRWAESHQYGPKKALQGAIYRIGGGQTTDLGKIVAILKAASINNQPLRANKMASQQQSDKDATGSPASFTNMSQADREAKVLQLLQSATVAKWQDPNPLDANRPQTSRRTDYADPKVQADVDAFESVAAQFAGKPFPATEPPEHMKNNPAHVQQWQAGYQAQMAAKAEQDAVKRARKMTEDQARQAAAALQQVNAQPAIAAAAAQQSTQDAHAAAWAAYYAQYGQAAAQQAAQPQQQAYGGGYDYSSVAQVMQALQGGQAQQPVAAVAAQPQVQQTTPAQDPNAQLMSLLSALGGGAQSSQPAQQPQSAQAYGAQSSADAQAAYWRALMEAAQNPAAVAQQQQHQVPQQQTPQPPQQSHQPSKSQQSYHHKDRDRAASRATAAAGGGDSGFLDYGPGPSDYDYSNESSSRGDKGAGRGGRKDKDNFRGGGAKDNNKDQKGINRALIGTKPCSFWAQGKCAKGDQCTFRHDPNDLK